MTGLTKQQRHRQQRIADGLCVKCGEKREAITPITCAACRAKTKSPNQGPHPWRKPYKGSVSQ